LCGDSRKTERQGKRKDGWVADQFGHSSPMITLKTCAHVLREEEAALSFADFSPEGVAGRL
jgi:hypothetical protein